jgi:hypothetical protein
MELSDTQGKVAIAIVVLLVLAIGWFMWKKSGPAPPTLGPGQTLQNPFGTGTPPRSGPAGSSLPGR